MLKKLGKKLSLVMAVCAITLLSSVAAFAEMTETQTAMQTALTTVQTDAIGALGIVAPIAIVIMGAFLVWRYGIKFFKGLAK